MKIDDLASTSHLMPNPNHTSPVPNFCIMPPAESQSAPKITQKFGSRSQVAKNKLLPMCGRCYNNMRSAINAIPLLMMQSSTQQATYLSSQEYNRKICNERGF